MQCAGLLTTEQQFDSLINYSNQFCSVWARPKRYESISDFYFKNSALFSARSISEEFSSGDGGRYRDEEYSQPHAPRDRQDKANKDKEDRDEGNFI